MRTIRLMVIYIVILIAFIATAMLAFDPSHSYELKALIPIVAATVAGFTIARIWPAPSTSHFRGWKPIVITLLILYSITFVFGIPSSQSDHTMEITEGYNQVLLRGYATPDQSFPYIRFFFSIPIFPGIIFSYYEYQIAGLAGLGAFELRIWYWVGSKEIARHVRWVS